MPKPVRPRWARRHHPGGRQRGLSPLEERKQNGTGAERQNSVGVTWTGKKDLPACNAVTLIGREVRSCDSIGPEAVRP